MYPLTGNFHISTHSADQQPENIDFAHVIHEVRFGSKIDNPSVPGTFNPLYGRARIDGNGKYLDWIFLLNQIVLSTHSCKHVLRITSDLVCSFMKYIQDRYLKIIYPSHDLV